MGFALAKGTTYKMTFSGPEGAKLNFPTVAASAVQDNADIDVKTAPGYWNDNNTVVFSGTVELSKASTPSLSGYYTTTMPITDWPSSGSSSNNSIAFKVNNTCTLNKAVFTAHFGRTATSITPYISTSATAYNPAVWTGTTINNANNINFGEQTINAKLNAGNYYIHLINESNARESCFVPENYGTIITGTNDIEAINTKIPLVANVSSTAYVPVPGETVVMYGDSKQTTVWDSYDYSGNNTKVYIPFILKKAAKVNVNFRTQGKATMYPFAATIHAAITNSDKLKVSNSFDYNIGSDWKTINASLTTNDVIPSGTYYIEIDQRNSFVYIKYTTTSGTLTNNEYIQVTSDGIIPSSLNGHAEALAKYTITT